MNLNSIMNQEAARLLEKEDMFKYYDMISLLNETDSLEGIDDAISAYSLVDFQGAIQGVFVIHKRETDKDMLQLDIAIFQGNIDLCQLIDLLTLIRNDKEYYVFCYGCELLGTSDNLSEEGSSIQFHHKDDNIYFYNDNEVILLTADYQDKLPVNTPEKVKHVISFLDEINGYGIIINEEVVSFCIPAPFGSYYADTKVREIMFVYTDERYRKRNLAKRVLAEATKFIKENDELPLYTAAPDEQGLNLASIATAKSVGYKEFIKIDSYKLKI